MHRRSFRLLLRSSSASTCNGVSSGAAVLTKARLFSYKIFDLEKHFASRLPSTSIAKEEFLESLYKYRIRKQNEARNKPITTTLALEAAKGGISQATVLPDNDTQSLESLGGEKTPDQGKNCTKEDSTPQSNRVSVSSSKMTSGTSQGKLDNDFKDAFATLARLVDSCMIEARSPVWCYAVTELSKKNRRQVFNILDTDEDRVCWLNFEYERNK